MTGMKISNSNEFCVAGVGERNGRMIAENKVDGQSL